MLALLKATLSVPLVSVLFAPEQVVEGAGVLASESPLGSDSVMPDCVSANALLLIKVTVSTALVFTGTLVGAKASVTVGGVTLIVTGVTHALALVPAADGAVVTKSSGIESRAT